MNKAFVASMYKRLSRSKYGAVRTKAYGHYFASRAEAEYFGLLRMREKAGEISSVVLQPEYPILINGVRVFVYRADFSFYDGLQERSRVIDVKGYDTPVSRLKRKCVRAFYDIDVEVVK